MKCARNPKIQAFTRMGFVLSLCGSAIGLGNIWKFPTMMASSGGSSFLLVYLVCLCLIGIPVLVFEMILGNTTQMTPRAYFKHTRILKIFRHLPALNNTLILSFYAVISGWILLALLLSVQKALTGQETLNYHLMVNYPWSLGLAGLLFVAITATICQRGIRDGIEKLNVIVLPMLMVIILGLVAYCFGHGFLSLGFDYMFGARNVSLSVGLVSAALGHAFFTLSLGTGVVWTYGHFLAKERHKPVASGIQNGLIIAGADTAFALLIGLIIFSVLLGTHMNAAGGPDLIFRVLPVVFSKIPLGSVIEIVFFVLVFVCALTSSVSMFEVMRHTRTVRETIRLGLLTWALSILTVVSLNTPSTITVFGATPFVHFDTITTRVLMPLFGILVFGTAIIRGVLAIKARRPLKTPHASSSPL